MSVAQLQRSNKRIGQSVCDGVVATGRWSQSDMHERNGPSIDIHAEVNRCQLENTNGGPHTKRGGGKASNIIHLCEGKTNEWVGRRQD